ncbi:MAG: MFS transporter [Deltaproteobacteria bacterium]|nr:MFS transporter [Deltaproteobacteria bacterium]
MDTTNSSKIGSWVKITSILIIVNCLALIPSMGYEPLGAAIKKTIAMSGTQWGFFTGMAGILAIICAIPAGISIKRFGARNVVLSGAFFMVAGLLLLSFAGDFISAISGRGVWQIGIRFLLPALTAALVVTVPDKYRSRVLGIGIAVSMLGTIVAQTIGAWISQNWGWQLAIQFFAAIVFISAAIFYISYRGNAAAEGEILKGNKDIIKDGEPEPRNVYLMPSIWLFCLLVIFGCEEGVVGSFVVLQMNEVWGTGELNYAWIINAGMTLAIIVNLGAGWAGDKFGRWNMLIITGILNTMVGICLLIGQFDNKGIYITGILIAKALQLTTTLFANSMAPTLLKGRYVAGIIAMIALGGGLGQFLGQQVLGIMNDATGGYSAGWMYITACGVVATLLAAGFKIYFDRQAKAEAA